MEVYIMNNKTTICRSPNLPIIPRIGEKLTIDGAIFTVKDVVWHVREGHDTIIAVLV